MASMMRTLMADFRDMAVEQDDMEYSMTMDDIISMVNNCHGMSSEVTLNVVETSMDGLVDFAELGVSGMKAVADAKIVLDMYREQLNSNS